MTPLSAWASAHPTRASCGEYDPSAIGAVRGFRIAGPHGSAIRGFATAVSLRIEDVIQE